MSRPVHVVPVRVVHAPTDGPEQPIATSVEFAEGLVAQGIGLMFRRSVPEEFALVFRFGRVSTRGLHMVFVPFDIDALWLVDGEVQAAERLPAWRGTGRARADTVIELPAGAADGVEPGDEIRVVEDDGRDVTTDG
jgi:uncharacterized membrane protein (UPF0127 family)